jgi:hypothetical protein
MAIDSGNFGFGTARARMSARLRSRRDDAFHGVSLPFIFVLFGKAPRYPKRIAADEFAQPLADLSRHRQALRCIGIWTFARILAVRARESVLSRFPRVSEFAFGKALDATLKRFTPQSIITQRRVFTAAWLVFAANKGRGA